MPARKTPPNPSLAEPAADGTQTDLIRAAIDVFHPDFFTLNLTEQIARISGMLGGLEKRGYNAFHKYHYVTEGDVVDTVRQYLAAAGILIIPDAEYISREGELTTLMVQYTVTNGRESFSFHMPGQGSDKGDKGVYKAMTGSQKYALMKLFKIETGDDPEGDTRVDERAATQQAVRAPVVTSGDRAGVGRGAHTELASPIQIRRINELMKEEDLDRAFLVKMVDFLLKIKLELPEEEAEQGPAILAFLRALTAEQAGNLLAGMTIAVEKPIENNGPRDEGVSDYS